MQRSEPENRDIDRRTGEIPGIVGVPSGVPVGQSVAVELLNKKVSELEQKIAAQAETIENRDREIALLREALQSERDARAALKTSNRLWEEQRRTVTGKSEE